MATYFVLLTQSTRRSDYFSLSRTLLFVLFHQNYSLQRLIDADRAQHITVQSEKYRADNCFLHQLCIITLHSFITAFPRV